MKEELYELIVNITDDKGGVIEEILYTTKKPETEDIKEIIIDLLKERYRGVIAEHVTVKVRKLDLKIETQE